MKTQLRLMISDVSRKTLVVATLMSLLALPVLCLNAHRVSRAAARSEARLQPKDVRQRTAAICMAMGAAHPTIDEPELMVQKFHANMPHGQRRLWVVECLAGSHHYNIIFNDLTGNVEGLFSDGLTSSQHRRSASHVALSSPCEALEGAVRRLQDLQMTPAGTRIQLAQRPLCDRDGITWRVVWKVLRPNAAAPYEIRMVLDGRDASPMIVVNGGEMTSFVHNGS